MRIRNPRLRLALRMSWYSMAVSSIGGALFTLPFLLDFPNSRADDLGQALILAVFFGAGTALLRRLLASILIGAAMAIVSGAFSDRNPNPWTYKFAMALTAAAVIHLFAPVQLARFYLTELTGGDYSLLLESLTAFAFYAGGVCLSQFVAGKYLREIAADD
ncbi:MAG: hypothetical protein OXI30_11955 [Chloroflexota bacterium]|nr:hypothetical protein [Chloroflexota bacterium]